jgi:ATP-dependent DNA helicase RecG
MIPGVFMENILAYWIVFRKDIYNEVDLGKLGLSERQIKAVLYVKEKGRITKNEYQKINEIGKSVTIEELRNLVEKQILVRIGKTGRGTYYELPK